MVLENINSPEDVKKLSLEELNLLGGEMREALLHRLSNHGGHFGPNFGMVEATIALHYVFNSPEDKIVFDVSHQSYPHKMLTGRKEAYLDPEKYDDVSGYSEPSESAHDHFVIGHTSTSVSLAGGLAKGSSFEQLVADQAHTIKAAVIIGRDQQPMLDAFKTSAPNIPLTIIDPADNGVIMERAVDAAGEYVQSGDVVLMAPACASMDQFKSYADRGNQFAQQAQRWVNEHGKA